MSNWRETTTRTAYKWAKDFYDGPLNDGVLPGIKKGLPPRREDAIEELRKNFQETIRNYYPEESWNDAEEAELTEFPSKKGYEWTMGLGKALDPKTVIDRDKFEKFNDLVKHDGVDGLGKWYSMTGDQLDYQMKGMGYNPGSQESKNEFLETLRQHQTNYDKMKVVNEYPVSRFLVAAAAPSAYSEAMEQALTDKPVDYDAIKGMFLTDQAFNAVTAGAARVPQWWGLGLATAGSEAARQGYNMGVHGTGFDPSAMILAPVNALMAGRAPLALSRGVRTADKTGFAAGLRKGAMEAGGDELAKETLKKSLIDAREAAANGTTTDAGAISLSHKQDMIGKRLGLLGYGERSLTENSPASAFKAVANDVSSGKGGAREYTIRQMLGLDEATPITDRQVMRSVDRAWKEPLKLSKPVKPGPVEPKIQLREQPEFELLPGAPEELRYVPPTKETFKWYAKEPDGMLSNGNQKASRVYFHNETQKRNPDVRKKAEDAAKAEYDSKLAQYDADMKEYGDRVNFAQNDNVIGAKFTEETGKPDNWYIFGREWGRTAPMVGAVSGANVVSPISMALHGDLEGLKREGLSVTDKYKEASWYKKLKKANPQAAAAFDAAVKAKKEEE